jgi:Sel1 repeat
MTRPLAYISDSIRSLIKKEKFVKLTSAVFLVLFLLPVLAFADQLSAGEKAYLNDDYQTALKLLQPLADQGNAEAQYDVGTMYKMGWGVKQDYTETAKWFRKAADQGDWEAQHEFGLLYHFGQGVTRDAEEAAFWTELGAHPTLEEKKRFPTLTLRLPRPDDPDGVKKYVPEDLSAAQKVAVEKRVKEWKPTPSAPSPTGK